MTTSLILLVLYYIILADEDNVKEVSLKKCFFEILFGDANDSEITHFNFKM